MTTCLCAFCLERLSRNDLYRVRWDVKPYSLTHSLTNSKRRYKIVIAVLNIYCYDFSRWWRKVLQRRRPNIASAAFSKNKYAKINIWHLSAANLVDSEPSYLSGGPRPARPTGPPHPLWYLVVDLQCKGRIMNPAMRTQPCVYHAANQIIWPIVITHQRDMQ